MPNALLSAFILFISDLFRYFSKPRTRKLAGIAIKQGHKGKYIRAVAQIIDNFKKTLGERLMSTKEDIDWEEEFFKETPSSTSKSSSSSQYNTKK